MRDWFGAVSAFAQEITVFRRDGVRHSRAFIQPLSLTEPQGEKTPTPVGTVDERRYLIIAAPGAFDGSAGVSIECAGRRYALLRCEKMGGGSHWEGLLAPEGGACDA